MIKEVGISNFKSVKQLGLSLGRLNILIGSNGSGKSNILEAIAFGGAAAADKLDNEFLYSRGIRPTPLMKSAFSHGPSDLITLSFKNGAKSYKYDIGEEGTSVPRWVMPEAIKMRETIRVDLEKNMQSSSGDNMEDGDFDNALGRVAANMFKAVHGNTELERFVIFSPEVNALRKLEDEGQIQPVGIRGEGLFNLLQILYANYGEDTINEIKEYLHLIEWFDDFEPIADKVSGRKMLAVKDINLPGVLMNQNSVNEGFLFLLFYISLIVSKETPSFFAIDNIEAALHPRLCEELTRKLAMLARKYNKQLIITTHNPFILDGLDLDDPEQKLFVVRRNADGETVADAIKPVKNMKLSEAWMKGRIGGQPETID